MKYARIGEIERTQPARQAKLFPAAARQLSDEALVTSLAPAAATVREA
jgi:hypothetical protein